MKNPKLYLVAAILSSVALLAGACAMEPTPASDQAPEPGVSPDTAVELPDEESLEPEKGSEDGMPTPPDAEADSPSAGTEIEDAPLATGNIEILVTDAPPREEVTGILVTISAVEIHQAVAEKEQEQEQEGGSEQNQEQQQEQQGEGEWITLTIVEEANPFDLVMLKELGLEELIALAEIEEGKYTQIRLLITSVAVAIADGEPEEAELPSGELKLVHPFDVVAGETTTIVVDFDAEKSVNITGSGKIIVNPVVKLITK